MVSSVARAFVQVGIASIFAHQNAPKDMKWRIEQKISEVSSPKGSLTTSYKLKEVFCVSPMFLPFSPSFLSFCPFVRFWGEGGQDRYQSPRESRPRRPGGDTFGTCQRSQGTWQSTHTTRCNELEKMDGLVVIRCAKKSCTKTKSMSHCSKCSNIRCKRMSLVFPWTQKTQDAINVCLATGDFHGARKSYNEALMLIQNFQSFSAPEISEVVASNMLREVHHLRLTSFLNLSQCELKMDDFSSAIGSARNALELDPGNCKALYRRGGGTVASGKTGRSQSRFAQGTVTKRKAKHRFKTQYITVYIRFFKIKMIRKYKCMLWSCSLLGFYFWQLW